MLDACDVSYFTKLRRGDHAKDSSHRRHELALRARAIGNRHSSLNRCRYPHSEVYACNLTKSHWWSRRVEFLDFCPFLTKSGAGHALFSVHTFESLVRMVNAIISANHEQEEVAGFPRAALF